MPFLWGDLVPEDTYPVLHMYLTALVLRVGALIDPHGPAGEPSWPQVVVGVRLLNAALGTVTVGLLAGLGRRLFGWRVGLLAAALLALSPVSIVNAHYEMGDVAQTLFVVAAVAAAGLALRSGSAAAILATGALAGLAASAKFFGVVVLATALVAVVGGRRRPPAHALLLLIGACVLTGAAFVLSTPLLLLEPWALAEPGPRLARAVHRRPAARSPAVLARQPRGPRPGRRVVRPSPVPGRSRRRRAPGAPRRAGGARARRPPRSCSPSTSGSARMASTTATS